MSAAPPQTFTARAGLSHARQPSVEAITRHAPPAADAGPDAPPRPPYDATYKMVLVGDSGVGKTSLCWTLHGRPGNATLATTGVDMLNKPYRLEGHTVLLQLWDTAGMERFEAVTRTAFNRARGVVLVYAVDDRRSFENAQVRWRRAIENNLPRDDDVPVFLIANKQDVREHAVPSDEGQRLAESMRWHFHEASAWEAERTEAIFAAVVRTCLRADRMLQPAGRPARSSSPGAVVALAGRPVAAAPDRDHPVPPACAC